MIHAKVFHHPYNRRKMQLLYDNLTAGDNHSSLTKKYLLKNIHTERTILLKELADTDQKSNFVTLNYQNNYVERSNQLLKY